MTMRLAVSILMLSPLYFGMPVSKRLALVKTYMSDFNNGEMK